MTDHIVRSLHRSFDALSPVHLSVNRWESVHQFYLRIPETSNYCCSSNSPSGPQRSVNVSLDCCHPSYLVAGVKADVWCRDDARLTCAPCACRVGEAAEGWRCFGCSSDTPWWGREAEPHPGVQLHPRPHQRGRRWSFPWCRWIKRKGPEGGEGRGRVGFIFLSRNPKYSLSPASRMMQIRWFSLFYMIINWFSLGFSILNISPQALMMRIFLYSLTFYRWIMKIISSRSPAVLESCTINTSHNFFTQTTSVASTYSMKNDWCFIFLRQ